MNWMKSCELIESKRLVLIARMNRIRIWVEYVAPHLLAVTTLPPFSTCGD